VEVKGIGSKAFEHFGEKDLRADYIVWVHFGEFYTSSGNHKIAVLTIRKPAEYFSSAGRVTMSSVKKLNAIADTFMFELTEL
jgi:hypothetical protein